MWAPGQCKCHSWTGHHHRQRFRERRVPADVLISEPTAAHNCARKRALGWGHDTNSARVATPDGTKNRTKEWPNHWPAGVLGLRALSHVSANIFHLFIIDGKSKSIHWKDAASCIYLSLLCFFSVSNEVSDTRLICRTSHSNLTGKVPVKVVFGKAERILDGVLFSYMEDPVINDASPTESFYGCVCSSPILMHPTFTSWDWIPLTYHLNLVVDVL